MGTGCESPTVPQLYGSFIAPKRIGHCPPSAGGKVLEGRAEVRRPASRVIFMPEILGVRMEGKTSIKDHSQ